MNHIDLIQYRKNYIFFDSYLKKIHSDISVVVVAHVLHDVMAYTECLNKYYTLSAIIPKPKSINKDFLNKLPKSKLIHLSRSDCKEPKKLYSLIKHIKTKYVVFMDIGGYFSESLAWLKNELGDRLLGIIEDTENGHQKYLKLPLPCPVISVARSPLKDTEDYLVGHSVVFSTETLLRKKRILVNNKSVSVLGYGKIGRGTASALNARHAKVSVFDIDPIKMVQAYSHGFTVGAQSELLKNAEIVFCASGSQSLKHDEFSKLRPGAFVASVTSSDDELDLQWVKKNYTKKYISEHIDMHTTNKHHFFLLNNGNAINFIHDTTVENFILLVQLEMMVAVEYLKTHTLKNVVQQLPSHIQASIASKWLQSFT